ncbi:MAG: hypothetical protein ABIQ13_11915 [Pedococcus sp.]
MSITSDPLSVAAEVAYRRETLAVGLPTVGRARSPHGFAANVLRHAPRLHDRLSTARHA